MTDNTKELKDEDLKQVSGGVSYTITKLDQGDCFINRYTAEKVYVHSCDDDVLTPSSRIRYKMYDEVNKKLVGDIIYTDWYSFNSEYRLLESECDPYIFMRD